MPEIPKPTPTVESVAQVLDQLSPDKYLEQVANPLILNYTQREFCGPEDKEISFSLTSLSANRLQIGDINKKHIHYAPMYLVTLGAYMIEEDIKPNKLTQEKLEDRSKTAFFLFSSMAWLEVTRRRHQGAINATALFRATEETFVDKLGSIFLELPLEERVEMFNAGYRHAYSVINEGGFTVITNA